MTLEKQHVAQCCVSGRGKCHHHNGDTIKLGIYPELGAVPYFDGTHLHQELSDPFLSFPTSVKHCKANLHMILLN